MKKELLRKLFTPFKTLSNKEQMTGLVLLVIGLLLLWMITASHSALLPSPVEVLYSIPRMVTNYSLFTQLGKSLVFCFHATIYAVMISLFFCYLSVIPLFRPLCEFMRKFRFLPSTGMGFLFMKVTVEMGGDITDQMFYMMVFGVTTFLIDSLISISLSIGPADIAYCKSLRLNRWQMVKELLIFGKASEIFAAAIQQFAMAWMLVSAIENIFKTNGGIGVVLAESNKYLRMDQIIAVQIIILVTGTVCDYGLRSIRLWLFPQERLKVIK